MGHEEAVKLAISTKNKTGPKAGPATWLGRWKNQMNSVMDLKVSGNDVTGSYTSASSAAGGAVSGTLKGNVSGDLISFLVLWPGGSMSAWTGQLVDDDIAPRIKTLWHLVTDIADAEEPTRLWTSTFSGADEFTR